MYETIELQRKVSGCVSYGLLATSELLKKYLDCFPKQCIGEIQESCGEIEEFCGELEECCGEIQEFCREIEECCAELGEIGGL
jgi:hypothetical protein